MLRRKGQPVSGDGVLGQIFFQAKGAGTSAVEINMAGAGGTGVPVSPIRGMIQVK
jgi:hypothetical protein